MAEMKGSERQSLSYCTVYHEKQNNTIEKLFGGLPCSILAPRTASDANQT
jgi:hypothetical protein